ncbi:MAG TPA: hypothetical protein VEY70_13155 [Metabacillus sp.]|nr:hypothetical protein [Metabacillus sp.]
MKYSAEYIYRHYPNVKRRIEGENIQLTNVEDIFYQLALFFNEPERYSFNLSLLYRYLEDDDLIRAIQAVIHFFKKDTYLLKRKNHSFINSDELENEKLYNQTMFAEYLTKKGFNYTSNKLGVYYQRGKLPEADIKINGTPYWYESTVELFAKHHLKA